MTPEQTYPDAFDLGMFLAVRAATASSRESRPVSENKEPHVAKFVYDFTEGNKDLKDLLGGKGANLAEMTNLGLPVPPDSPSRRTPARSTWTAATNPRHCVTR